MKSPMEHCHIVTSTTHKTLRGPRGGIIMLGKNFENPWGRKTRKGNPIKMSSIMNSAVFPGMQGGPLEHVIAAKAVAFGEALTDEFKAYAKRVTQNAQALANALVDRGYKVISGGTDNHLMLIDLRNKGITGKAAEEALIKADITTNKNMVPFDDQSPFVTSGMRLGTAAITSRGMNEDDCRRIAAWIDRVITNPEDESVLKTVNGEVREFASGFPLFPEI